MGTTSAETSLVAVTIVGKNTLLLLRFADSRADRSSSTPVMRCESFRTAWTRAARLFFDFRSSIFVQTNVVQVVRLTNESILLPMLRTRPATTDVRYCVCRRSIAESNHFL